MPFEHFHMFTTDYSNSLVDLYSIFHTQAKQGDVGTALEAMLLSMTLRYLVTQSWLKKLSGRFGLLLRRIPIVIMLTTQFLVL